MSEISAESIARGLNGRKASGGWMARCPAHDDRTPSLSIREGDKGPVFKCHAGCSQDDVLDALRGLGLWPERGERHEWRPPPPKMRRYNQENSERALAIWNETVHPRGTLVERYLASRKADLPNDVAGRVIRFHPRCPFGPSQRLPCLVARFSPIAGDLDPETPPSAIHRIRLDTFTGPGRKLSLGSTAGQCVKLSHNEDVTKGLGLTEGIEDALGLMTRIGWRPIWATISAGTLSAFPVLSGIECLTVFADHDVNEAGQKAALAVERRWLEAGLECRAVWPKTPGNDWNDEVMS